MAYLLDSNILIYAKMDGMPEHRLALEWLTETLADTVTLENSNVQLYHPSERHFTDLAEFMKEHKFSGNLTMDAHLAVVALITGATLVTRDGDFAKVPYLKTLNPLGTYSDE